MGWRGLLSGAMALIVLEVLVKPDKAGGTGAADRVSALFAWPAAMAERFINPDVPAIGAAAARPDATPTAVAIPAVVSPPNPVAAVPPNGVLPGATGPFVTV